jgi:hypothetical protein
MPTAAGLAPPEAVTQHPGLLLLLQYCPVAKEMGEHELSTEVCAMQCSSKVLLQVLNVRYDEAQLATNALVEVAQQKTGSLPSKHIACCAAAVLAAVTHAVLVCMQCSADPACKCPDIPASLEQARAVQQQCQSRHAAVCT